MHRIRKSMWRIALCLAATFVCSPAEAVIQVDIRRAEGIVKPVNGVGQGPSMGLTNFSMFKYLGQAGIPYCRLHDVGGSFGMNVFVDIPNVFRDFDADENDPENYDFTFTDLYLKALIDNGVEPYYRLGVTIENAAKTKAYRIHPPKDYSKWARICEHIIRHYTEGWANGYEWNITHWEIWNEPENSGPDPKNNQMWTGTWQQFMDFYATAATYLKKQFPHLKIGGYGSCGFYADTSIRFEHKEPNPAYKYYIDCFEQFLAYARDNHLPLDFCSMHSYATVFGASEHVKYCRRKLDEYGFKDTEIDVNEWLPSPKLELIGTAKQAAMLGAGLVMLQNSAATSAMLYDARIDAPNAYAPLWNANTMEPYKAYSAFLMFNELRKLGKSTPLQGVPSDLWATAATDGQGHGAIMLSNITGKTVPLVLTTAGGVCTEAVIVDEEHNMDVVPMPTEMKPNTLLLLRLNAGE